MMLEEKGWKFYSSSISGRWGGVCWPMTCLWCGGRLLRILWWEPNFVWSRCPQATGGLPPGGWRPHCGVPAVPEIRTAEEEKADRGRSCKLRVSHLQTVLWIQGSWQVDSASAVFKLEYDFLAYGEGLGLGRKAPERYSGDVSKTVRVANNCFPEAHSI